MRLIDADALFDEFLKRYTEMERNRNLVFAACEIKQNFADMVSNFQPVDAVEVVRCKDCIHSYDDLCGLCCTFGPSVDCIVPPDFYCADGKRRGAACGVE